MAAFQVQFRIEDPAFHRDPFSAYAQMRAVSPALLREDIRVWFITGYDEVVKVSKDGRLFSCKEGILLSDFITGTSAAEAYFVGPELVVTTDPPRHNELRRLISPAFAPRRVAQMEDRVRAIARELVRALPAGESIDFMAMVAKVMPLVVVARLLGVTNENITDMARWSDELMTLGQDVTDEERQASVAAFDEMNQFMRAQFAEKRAKPAEDLLSTLLHAELDNEKVSDDNILMWASLILAGGDETTRSLMGNMVSALAEHPDQLTLLAADPEGRAISVVEETLRWRGPVNGFGRRVTAGTELAGQYIPEGDAVFMLYPAANRDPRAFDNPEVFDITVARDKEHVAFGVGQHFCPGNLLARLEARVMLEELVRRFPTWTVDSYRSVESVLRTAYRELFVTFHERG